MADRLPPPATVKVVEITPRMNAYFSIKLQHRGANLFGTLPL